MRELLDEELTINHELCKISGSSTIDLERSGETTVPIGY